MAKFDEQLSRMSYLMEFKSNNGNGVTNTNIEYHANGADGKVYGILREGTKYYIKTTTPGKETLSESYEYINGYNYRNENGYNSYNEATKQLELKLMSLNEAYGVKEDVSTFDFKRGEKMLSTLTEEARKELDRVNQIMENSTKIGIKANIGDHGDSESKGKSTGADTKKNNKPFDETPKADGTNDSISTESNPAKANANYTDVSKKADSQLQNADKMAKGVDSWEKDTKEAHDDLDGEGVADKKPKGGKVTHVNESFEDGLAGFENEDNKGDISDEDFEEAPELTDIDGFTPEVDNDSEVIGGDFDETFEGEPIEDEDDDFDMMLQEMENLISGENDVMQGPGTDNANNSLSMKEAPTKSPIKEDDENHTPEQPTNDTPLNHLGKKGTLPSQVWDKMNESIDRIAENVYRKITGQNGKRTVKESLSQMINRIVKEETTRLNAWGKHPRYGRQPMTTPQNTEKFVGTADRDWNDDSAKGSERYGKRIGSGAPFDKEVEMLTDAVLSQLKESYLKKK